MKLTELRKLAQYLGFVDRMQALDFALGPSGFWFYRKRDEYIDVFDFWMKSSMKWVQVPLVCLSEDIVVHCDMKEFPRGFNKGMPIYSGAFISKDGVEIGGGPWKVSSEEEVTNSLNELADVIESNVDPWFRRINSREALFSSFSERFRLTDEGRKIKEQLGLGV